MNLRQLNYFVTLAEELHFGRAAERLHMAQPPLSQAIRKLEAEVGVKLLSRTTRSVNLTEAGSAYVERARSILASVEDATSEARLVAAGYLGRLTIGCVGSATYSLLPTLSRSLTTDLPGIEFAFRGEMLVPDQVEALREGSIDLALMRPPILDASLTVSALRRDRLVVALPMGHRLSNMRQVRASDLAGVDLIIHSANKRSMMYDTTLGLLRGAGVEPAIRHEVGETSTLVTLVAGGLGAAVVPEPVAALAIDGVVYRPLIQPAVTIDLVAAHRTDRTEPHLLRTLATLQEIISSSPQAAKR